jgi:hypothetical protein
MDLKINVLQMAFHDDNVLKDLDLERLLELYYHSLKFENQIEIRIFQSRPNVKQPKKNLNKIHWM